MKIWRRVLQGILRRKSSRTNARKDASLQLESLEIRSLLASHPLADAPDVDYVVTDEWGTGHTAALTLTNDETTSFSNWQLEFDYNGQIDSIWNATVTNLGSGRYAITPPSWDNTLDSGESLAVGFTASGTTSISNITFNGTGSADPGNPTTPPADGDDDTPITPPTPVEGAPNAPSVSVLTNWEAGGYDLTVNLWSGEPAASWKLYENGELIHEAEFTATATTPQSSSINISDKTYGVYNYQVEVSNAAGSTTSDAITHVVGGASQIEIDEVDAQGQALQVTIDQGSANYQLSLGDSESAAFSVATNNSRVVSAEIINGDTLQVTGLDAGRASVKLTDQATGETRYLGFRVRTAEGELPGLPDYLTIGSVSEDSQGDLDFWRDFDNADPLTGKYVDSRYIYLNGGPVNGWRTWGDRVGSYLRESLKLGMIPQFVYYNIPDGGESYTTNNEHISSVEYMEGYFNDLNFALDTIASEAGDELVQFIMEPDFIGYLMQNAGKPASELSAVTSAAYSSGVLEAGVDPQFDNTVTGLIEAINYTISSHAANVEFGWQFNLWASPGIETPIGGDGIVHLTDTMGMEAGRAAIAREAELIAEYYIDAGVLSYGAEFISVDKYGLDAGAQNGAAADPASSTWFWNSDHWNNYLLVVETLSNTTSREMILWQLPVGHINDSLAPNPYDADGTFESLPNTTRQYEDSAPTFFLGDTFTATGPRLDYFASNDFGDPKLSVDGSTVTWGSHMEEARGAGVRQMLFGAGVGISTDSIGTEPTDDYWWITQVQEYYQNPVPAAGTVITPPPQTDPVDPPVDETPVDPPADPVTPPMDDHDDHDEGTHDPMDPPPSSGDYIDITTWGMFHDSNDNSEHDELVGGRTAITTEATEAYNNLRAFFGLSAITIEDIGEWAFANELTNNTEAWGNDLQGVGLYYAMQGAKVGWIADETYDPQILADIQRTARLGDAADVMDMVRQFGIEGFAEYLEQYGIDDTFINTLKMEPHYGGWMHGRTHGWRSIEGVAIAHDVNHLTVLSWDQTQPFMNDTFDWPQWPALDVSDSGVIEYFQSMIVLGNPVGENMEFAPAPVDPPVDETPTDPVDPPVDETPVDPPAGDGPVQVADIEILEGDSGFSQALFTVNRSFTDAPLTLTYATEDGSAVAGEDYLTSSGTLTLATGQSSAQIAVTILGDTQFEANESFTLGIRSVEAEEPPVSTPADPQNPVEQPVVAAYYPEWGIYGRNYQIADVPGDDLTHFIYAFANLTAGGEMVLFDSFAATEKRFSADESVSGEADLWSYPAEDPRSQQTVWGNFNQVAQLKAKYPHLRTSIALGGWTLSGNFSSVCATAQGRETLASSIYDFLGTYTMFDGIDFDWEYPGGGGLGGNSESPQDGANYASLLELVRGKLDQLGADNDRYYEITVASPGGSDKIANFNVSGVNQYVDFFNVMAYDFHGTWENTTGHQAALTNDANGYDIETAVNLYLSAGVPNDKIILGAPAYTRAWSGVADGGDNGYSESASGAAPGTFESGNYDYKDLASQYLAGSGDWELNWDDDAQAAYLYSASQGVFSSFETPGSISLKSEWAQDLGLGGMMFWDVSNDAAGNESLIGAAADSWFAGKTFEEITTASDFVFDNIYGGNGIFDPVVEANTTPTIPSLPVNGSPIDIKATGTILNDDNTVNPPAPPVDDTPVDPPADPVTPPVDETPADPPVSDPGATSQIIDNGGIGFTQDGFTYMSNQHVADAVGGDVHQLRGGSGVATWTFDNLEAGTYRVATTWQGKYDNKYNASDAPYTVSDAAGNVLAQAVVDQTAVPADFEDAGNSWHALGTVTIADGTLTVTLSEGTNANRYVIADAVRIERVSNGAPADPVTPPVDETPADPPVSDPVEPPVDPPVDDPVGSGQIIDNGEAGFTQTGFAYLSNQQVAEAVGGDIHQLRGGSGTANWTFENLEPGEYRVATTWYGKYNNKYNATDAPYTVLDGAGNVLATATVDQSIAPAEFADGGKTFNTLATVSVVDGTLRVTLSEGTNPNRYVIADAVRVERFATDTPIDPPVDDPADPVYDGLNYAEALQKSFLFYEANRSGDLDEATKRIDWRGDSTLTDGEDGIYFGDRTEGNLQQGLAFDLTGGYFDAGDHGKFGLPLASTLTTLAWGGLAHADGYAASGQTDELLAAIRWGTDYLLKAHVTDANGDTAFFIVQVGDVSEDHALWSAPEDQTILRPAMAITPDKPGSDVSAQSAAAMASASILFRNAGEIEYANTLLENATALYDFADTYRGKYSDSVTEVQDYYASWSGYHEDLATGAAWLARATDAAGGDGTAYREKALATYRSDVGGLNNSWTHNWDDSSYAAAVLLAEDTGDAAIRQDVEGWLNNWVGGGGGVTITEGGLRYISQWGSLRYAANTALLAGIYADNVNDPGGAYSQLAQDTVDYILGENPVGISYIVGFGESYPQQPHHRAASGVGWEDFRNGQPNEHILYGALVGGPKAADDYSYNDSRDDYISNEVAIDYNAGITGALARSTARLGGQALTSEELDALDGVSDPTDGEAPSQPSDPQPEPVVPPTTPEDPVNPPVDDPADPVTPPMDDHDPMDPPPSSGDYIDITTWGMFHDSNDNSEHDELVGGRTAITTEATEAYNNLRAFFGLSAITIEDIGEWAFANELTNNTQAWGDDVQGVGLYYAMQGAKVGWIADETYDPQILADIQRTARLGEAADVMDMVRQFGIEGFAEYLEQYGIDDTFINTLKMEPHYGGWMHGRTHGWRSIEGVAIAHDVNHLTVLSWDQTQPFMNDTFDWPQWPALDVSDSGVIEYFQSMVVLGNPVGENMEFAPAPTDPPINETPTDPVDPPIDPGNAAAITYAVIETWEGGFTGNLTIRNTGGDALNGWTLEFTFAKQIDAIWNASVVSQEGDRYVITNADWNAQVAADGEVTFGFTVVGSQDSLPSDIVFNGEEILT